PARRRRLALDPLDDHAALEARVFDDLADWLLERSLDDQAADLVVPLQLEAVDRPGRPKQRHAAARHDAFLDGRAGRVQRVLDAGLLLLHRGLGGRADLDHRHAAGQLRQPLLQLLAVVVRGRLLDLGPDLLDPPLDRSALARALDEGRVVLVHDYLLGSPEIVELDVLELDAELLCARLAAG